MLACLFKQNKADIDRQIGRQTAGIAALQIRAASVRRWIPRAIGYTASATHSSLWRKKWVKGGKRRRGREDGRRAMTADVNARAERWGCGRADRCIFKALLRPTPGCSHIAGQDSVRFMRLTASYTLYFSLPFSSPSAPCLPSSTP